MKLRNYLTKLGALALSLTLLGCLPEKTVIWSPDGNRAVVLASQDLYLCDAKGSLSPLLATNIVSAAWLPDSERLVVNRLAPVTTWKDLVAALDPDQIKGLGDRAVKLLGDLKSGRAKWDEVLKQAREAKGDQTTAALILCLRDQHAAELQTLGADDRANLEAQVSCLQVATARPGLGPIEFGPILGAAVVAFPEIRIAPGGKAVAVVSATNALAVALTDQPKSLVQIETTVARFPDWTPDGQSLVYVKALGETEGVLGLLRSRPVFDAGHLILTNTAEDLAGVLIGDTAKVRCLRDGRILFTSMEVPLPATAHDMPEREQLFALDPTRQATIVRLLPRGIVEETPKSWFSFEVSPDEKYVSVLDDKSRVITFDLVNAKIETVQAARQAKEVKFVPTWRPPNELCYAWVKEKSDTTQAPDLAVGLWKAGQTRYLSETWPAEVTDSLLK